MDPFVEFAVGMASICLILTMIRALLRLSARSRTSTSTPSALEGDWFHQRFTCVNSDCESFDHWILMMSLHSLLLHKDGVLLQCPSCGNDAVYIGTTSS